jgi:ADP-ribose pyrophosphatase YjhB (NUDIX family)
MDLNNKIEQMEDTVVPKSKWIPEELFKTIQQTIPVACVDLIILRRNEGVVEILLVKRKIYPEIGKWCMIGGRIIKGESSNDAIQRQAKNEIGVSVDILPPWNDTTPIMGLSDPLSDAQKHFVVLVYPVTISEGVVNESGPEFSESKWFPIDKVPELAFAHHKELDSFIKTPFSYNLK